MLAEAICFAVCRWTEPCANEKGVDDDAKMVFITILHQFRTYATVIPWRKMPLVLIVHDDLIGLSIDGWGQSPRPIDAEGVKQRLISWSKIKINRRTILGVA